MSWKIISIAKTLNLWYTLKATPLINYSLYGLNIIMSQHWNYQHPKAHQTYTAQLKKTTPFSKKYNRLPKKAMKKIKQKEEK
jgi:hypothetical protein